MTQNSPTKRLSVFSPCMHYMFRGCMIELHVLSDCMCPWLCLTARENHSNYTFTERNINYSARWENKQTMSLNARHRFHLFSVYISASYLTRWREMLWLSNHLTLSTPVPVVSALCREMIKPSQLVMHLI